MNSLHTEYVGKLVMVLPNDQYYPMTPEGTVLRITYARMEKDRPVVEGTILSTTYKNSKNVPVYAEDVLEIPEDCIYAEAAELLEGHILDTLGWDSMEEFGRDVAFEVNRNKRKVTLIGLRKSGTGLKSVAKCYPDDIFNEDIGRLISLYRVGKNELIIQEIIKGIDLFNTYYKQKQEEEIQAFEQMIDLVAAALTPILNKIRNNGENIDESLKSADENSVNKGIFACETSDKTTISNDVESNSKEVSDVSQGLFPDSSIDLREGIGMIDPLDMPVIAMPYHMKHAHSDWISPLWEAPGDQVGFNMSFDSVGWGESRSDAELHKEILDLIHDTYKRKNADYGNSFSEQYKEHGMISSVIRLDDKMRRLKQLVKALEAQVKEESIRDTLLDMANYAIMTVMELDRNATVH